MIVLVPKTSGFCPGVQRAEDGVFKLKEQLDHVNLHGPLIHNQNYIQMLDSKKISSVDIDSLPNGETLVIRTHGIPRDEELQLSKRFILQDMTCPIVKRVQKHVEKASLEYSYVIISGKANHAEVKGLVSYAKYYLVIENDKELQEFIQNPLIPQECERILILSQTTHSKAFFDTLCQSIQQAITNIPVTIKNTICPVTENKEQESLTLQKEVDFTVVIGDPSSSNSKKLYNILYEASNNTIFTQNLTHLQAIKNDWQGISKVLVVSSTSTPLFIEKEIVTYLQTLEQ